MLFIIVFEFTGAEPDTQYTVLDLITLPRTRRAVFTCWTLVAWLLGTLALATNAFSETIAQLPVRCNACLVAHQTTAVFARVVLVAYTFPAFAMTTLRTAADQLLVVITTVVIALAVCAAVSFGRVAGR